MLVNLNNLTLFGDTPALAQHQQIGRFRAIENRRALVRCGITGSTAAISATGRVEQQAPPHEQQTLLANVSLIDVQTVYTRWGDVLPMICLVAFVVMFGSRMRVGLRPPEPGH